MVVSDVVLLVLMVWLSSWLIEVSIVVFVRWKVNVVVVKIINGWFFRSVCYLFGWL